MIVECPACHTRYRTDDSVDLNEDTLFECSREQCGHVFPSTPDLFRKGPPEEPPVILPPPDIAAEQGSLRQPLKEDHPAKVPLSPQSVRRQSPAVQPPEEWSETFDEPEDFAPLTPEQEAFSSSSPMHSSRLDEENEDEVSSRSRPQPTPETTITLWRVLALLALLVLGYAGLEKYCRSHIAGTEAVLAHLPLVGSYFLANRFSAQHISLSDLNSGFWLTKDRKRVFAVSGKATNNAAVPAYTIQIEGELYNTEGKMVGHRLIYCGTETASEVLPNLTTREIGILQNLVPPKQFNVPAGQSVNFLLVFTNPPPTVTELSYRVAAAQFGAS